MIVATYFESLLPEYEHKNHGALVELWKASWSAQGCEPLVLGEREASKHASYSELKRKSEKLPTVNPRKYEQSCFLRWAAAATVFTESTQTVFMDYDVFPTEHWNGWPSKRHELAHFDHIPSCVSGTVNGVDNLIAALLSYQAKTDEKHTSDMCILWGNQHIFDGQYRWTKCYGVPGWDKLPLVHFGSWYMPENNRHKVVSGLMDLGKRIRTESPYALPESKLAELSK